MSASNITYLNRIVAGLKDGVHYEEITRDGFIAYILLRYVDVGGFSRGLQQHKVPGQDSG